MTNFNFYDYQRLKDNQVLKMKLKGQDESFFVSRVYKDVLQAFQTTYTPITKINLDVIKDLDLYKKDKENDENSYQLSIEPEEVEQVEVVGL